MLARVDRVVAAVSWLAAAVLVVMLFVGPQLIAEDESKPTSEAAGSAPYASGSGGSEADGKSVFVDNCGSCHALESAGTGGQVGPSLDGTSRSASEIEAIVRDGIGGMPSFEGDLSDAEIEAVAAFVAASR